MSSFLRDFVLDNLRCRILAGFARKEILKRKIIFRLRFRQRIKRFKRHFRFNRSNRRYKILGSVIKVLLSNDAHDFESNRG